MQSWSQTFSFSGLYLWFRSTSKVQAGKYPETIRFTRGCQAKFNELSTNSERGMPTITFTQSNGIAESVAAENSISVMDAAVVGSVDGIVGECGGQAMCGTCHVYVTRTSNPLPELSSDEEDMLDYTEAERRPESRLSCQLNLGAVGDITVEVPEPA